ncbi:MAG: NAD(+)/NADH kinase [Candidatus Omnitrophica bacterium]|nr:NAD(+)/NADH kinase [Candidatus Omnitrophota bacterium]
MNKHKNILLLYKNSTYASYFLSDRRRLAQLQGLFNSQELKRFRKTHENHFWTLSYVEAVLKHRKLKFTKICRGTGFNYKLYDLIITVGGDGTFLEAARNLTGSQVIWGINSDPTWSVGRFCSGNARNFERMLDAIMQGKAAVRTFNRLLLSFDNGTQPMNAVNDVLVCHHNPAALSRYYITAGKIKEEQRSSGVWVSTAAGSSGGIHSAGGKILPQNSRNIQYKPRELYRGHGTKYRLTGGVLKPRQKITMTSLIREGVVFVDGSHICLPFSFGAAIQVGSSPEPLKVII